MLVFSIRVYFQWFISQDGFVLGVCGLLIAVHAYFHVCLAFIPLHCGVFVSGRVLYGCFLLFFQCFMSQDSLMWGLLIGV